MRARLSKVERVKRKSEKAKERNVVSGLAIHSMAEKKE